MPTTFDCREARQLLSVALLLLAQAERKLDVAEKFLQAATERVVRGRVEAQTAAALSAEGRHPSE